MTEEQWLACADPRPLLEYLRPTASPRKLRLFAVGCCRLHGRAFFPRWSWPAVQAAERFADGDLSAADLRQVRADAQEVQQRQGRKNPFRYRPLAALATANGDAFNAAVRAAELAAFPPEHHSVRHRIWARQAWLLREVFGNPFRPPLVDAGWLSWDGGLVPRLAQSIYEGRTFERLAVLGDALEDAGCDDAELLGHLRGGGEHYRGCWALDLLLGLS
jgi:hypothetical protein